ncbi:hypothetical protein ACFVVM_32370 [Nocardia sp. NPDC058176]|uniref:ATP dependent DNA ligase n=1 Tax=Nocardia sp. NPDC058176 TaxID=3346368 RepID=UPI0036D7717E
MAALGTRRQAMLLRVPPNWALSEVSADTLLQVSAEHGLEGIVVKRGDSIYQPGKRSTARTKVVLRSTTEAIVAGVVPGRGALSGTVGSLVLAAHDPSGRLRWIGTVGSGLTTAQRRWWWAELDAIRCDTRPIAVSGSIDPSRKSSCPAQQRGRWSPGSVSVCLSAGPAVSVVETSTSRCAAVRTSGAGLAEDLLQRGAEPGVSAGSPPHLVGGDGELGCGLGHGQSLAQQVEQPLALIPAEGGVGQRAPPGARCRSMSGAGPLIACTTAVTGGVVLTPHDAPR